MSGIAVAAAGDLVAITPPFLSGISEVVVGPNNFFDDLRIDFDGTVSAVGLYVYTPVAPTSVDINIYG